MPCEKCTCHIENNMAKLYGDGSIEFLCLHCWINSESSLNQSSATKEEK